MPLRSFFALPAVLLTSIVVLAPAGRWLRAADEEDAVERLLDRIVDQEQHFVEDLRTHSAILETYIQETPNPGGAAEQTLRDHYFLGRLELSRGLNYTSLASHTDVPGGWKRLLGKNRPTIFLPSGFAQMVLPDADSLDRKQYRFEYVRREFLGEIRCLLFDVAPLDKKASGKFIGRIWVDDRELRIVRFNGTYTNSTASHQYFHFDSWRVNVAPGRWVPGYIYVEESQPSRKNSSLPLFKAQTRLWGYNSVKTQRLEELSAIAVEAQKPIQDDSPAPETSRRSKASAPGNRQAEINILERLEKSGLLAPAGSVEGVLNTVINNLIVTNNLNIQATGRVLLTTPLETFAVGQTIVISRGLLDVLPDEASLAMVLSDELAHIALGHRTDTHFSFSDQTMLGDADLLKRLQLGRPPEEIAAAGAKAVEMLSKSPYASKLSNAGLFLKALSSQAVQLPESDSRQPGQSTGERDEPGSHGSAGGASACSRTG